MKTTTYIFANGVTTKIISDQPELTPEQYASARAVIRKAASQYAASLRASRRMHESEQSALMRRVSHIFQTVHGCSQSFSDWKVTDMSVAELQHVIARQEAR